MFFFFFMKKEFIDLNHHSYRRRTLVVEELFKLKFGNYLKTGFVITTLLLVYDVNTDY